MYNMARQKNANSQRLVESHERSDKQDALALHNYPSKLFVETTTRCNLKCAMCVKESPRSGIIDGDLSIETFDAISPALPNIEALILNGIGEPLLHPRIEEFIHRAKLLMKSGSWVGFQSNGTLLSEQRAGTLVEAGLDRICLSIDALLPETFRTIRKGAELDAIERAFVALREAKRRSTDSKLTVGIQFVLNRDNMHQLPATLKWAASRGATFAIVTHLISYDPSMYSKVAYDRNTREALELFTEWKQREGLDEVDIARYFDFVFKYLKTDEQRRICSLVESLKRSSASLEVSLHLENLLKRDAELYVELEQIFQESQETALETGLDLRLPAIAPEGRKCEFIESGSAFVSRGGDVHPCYFLWHGYSCYVSGWHKSVNSKIFGNLSKRGILDIWNDPESRMFRQQVLTYDYPVCSNCGLVPCDYVESKVFEQDCYTNTIPCCDCQWCLGIFQCLQ
jgi:putative metalloenzyme radical SAM/SPASM domain maturase